MSRHPGTATPTGGGCSVVAVVAVVESTPPSKRYNLQLVWRMLRILLRRSDFLRQRYNLQPLTVENASVLLN